MDHFTYHTHVLGGIVPSARAWQFSGRFPYLDLPRNGDIDVTALTNRARR